jgi:hypothetical protein
MMRALVFAMGLAVALPAAAQKPAPAGAQSGAKSANITGGWSFITQTYSNGCRMSGQMTLRPSPAGKHACTFTTQEKCNDITVHAKESCEAVRDGGKLTIKSTVNAVDPKVGYEPDDFELTIENGARMTGMMRSFNSAPVEFFRGDAPIS